jgi:hypothetical protein
MHDKITLTAILVKETVIHLRDNMRNPEQIATSLVCALVMACRLAGVDPREALNLALDAENELPLNLNGGPDA